MHITHHLFNRHQARALLLVTALFASGLANTAEKSISENQLNQVSLPAESIKKLGLTTSRITLARQSSTLSFPAQTSLAPEALAAYSMPMSGYVVFNAGKPLQVGNQIKAGQTLFTIQPVVTPEARLSLITSMADAEGQLQAAEKQLSAHMLTLNRAKQLWLQRVGSQRAVDDAQANVAIAETNARTAMQKRDLLKQAVEQGSAGNYTIKAANDGVISNLYFSPGQLMVAGAKLVDIAQQGRLWVTAYVPHAQVGQLNLGAEAWLAGVPGISADYVLKPVAAPQEGDALTGTRKLIYTLQAKSDIVPLQRLTIQIPQRAGEQARASVPCAATVVDIYGNTWLYSQLDDTHFSRQQVFITRANAQACVLSDQRLVGKQVVTQGAQELFAVETGYTH